MWDNFIAINMIMLGMLYVQYLLIYNATLLV
jgi:hypothetical protein